MGSPQIVFTWGATKNSGMWKMHCVLTNVETGRSPCMGQRGSHNLRQDNSSEMLSGCIEALLRAQISQDLRYSG